MSVQHCVRVSYTFRWIRRPRVKVSHHSQLISRTLEFNVWWIKRMCWHSVPASVDGNECIHFSFISARSWCRQVTDKMKWACLKPESGRIISSCVLLVGNRLTDDAYHFRGLFEKADLCWWKSTGQFHFLNLGLLHCASLKCCTCLSNGGTVVV